MFQAFIYIYYKSFDKHRCFSPTRSFYAICTNHLKYKDPKVINQTLWNIYSIIWHRRMSASYFLSNSYDHSFLLYKVLALGRWWRNFFNVINYHIFRFRLRVFKWTFTFEMLFIRPWTNQYKPHRHMRRFANHYQRQPITLFVYGRFPHIPMTLNAEIWLFGYSEAYVMSDFIQNIRKTSQVRWTFNIDTRRIK